MWVPKSGGETVGVFAGFVKPLSAFFFEPPAAGLRPPGSPHARLPEAAFASCGNPVRVDAEQNGRARSYPQLSLEKVA